jgi:hypothetical protein
LDQTRTIPHASRDGMMFVVSPASALPARCLKCNADCGEFQVSRRISTLSPWYPLFSSAGWNAHCPDDRPIFITYGLCLRHRLQFIGRLSLIIAVAVANLFCLVIYHFLPATSPALDALAVALPIIFVLIALTLRPLHRPRRVHHGLAWFAGAGPEFLNSLPNLESIPPTSISPNPR